MDLTPSKIFDEYQKNNIDKLTASDFLISIIENSDNNKDRVACIENLEKIGIKSISSFKLLESLLISDSNEEVRVAAAKNLSSNFTAKGEALEPMKWVILHETSPVCLKVIYEALITIISNLVKSNDNFAKIILLEEVKQIKKKDYRIGIEILSESNPLNSFEKEELADILINFYTISLLEKTYWRLKYKLEKCKIVELDFIFKGLTNMPEAIKNLKLLRKLIFRYNQIISIPDWINQLSSLEILNLNVNNINKLPESIGFLSSLKELLLWKNELTSLPGSITSLSSLEVFNLRINHLNSLPESIGNLISLKELNLHDNKLIKLPKSIGDLVSLEILNLSWNELEDVPDSIGSLTSLKILDMGKNELINLPSSIGSLSSLEILDLSGNNIEHIPETIGHLSSLQILDLSRNKLKILPESITQISTLKEIYLSNNDLSDSAISILKRVELKGTKVFY